MHRRLPIPALGFLMAVGLLGPVGADEPPGPKGGAEPPAPASAPAAEPAADVPDAAPALAPATPPEAVASESELEARDAESDAPVPAPESTLAEEVVERAPGSPDADSPDAGSSDQRSAEIPEESPAAVPQALPALSPGVFPRGSLLSVEIADLQRLRRELARTLPVQILTHPAWRSALDAARDRFGGLLGPVATAAGVGAGAGDLLALLPGTCVLDVDAPDADGAIAWTASAELRGERERIAAILDRLAGAAASDGAGSSQTRVVKDVPVTTWCRAATAVAAANAATEHTFLRGWAAVGAPGARLEDWIAAALPLDAGSSPGELPAPVRIAGSDVVARADLAAASRALRACLTDREASDLGVILRASGLDGLKTLWAAAAVKDGVVERAWWLPLDGKPRGLVDVLVRGAGTLDFPDRLPTLVPARANGVVGFAVRPGAFLRGLDGLARRRLPELGAVIDAAYARAHVATGISARDDLFGLGDLQLVAFSVAPPAGGWTPDVVVLGRTEQIAPHWSLLERLAARAGVEVRQLTGSPSIRCVLTAPLTSALRAEWYGDASAPGDVGSLVVGLLPALCRFDLEDGWSALSGSAQTLARYRDVYRSGPKIADDPALAERVRLALRGATAAGWAPDGRVSIALYNALVSAGTLAFALAPENGDEGFEPALLPPAESFLAYCRPASFRWRCDASGFGWRARGDGGVAAVLAAILQLVVELPVQADSHGPTR